MLKSRPIPKYNFGKYREPVIEDNGDSDTNEDEALEDDLDYDTTVVVNSSYTLN